MAKRNKMKSLLEEAPDSIEASVQEDDANNEETVSIVGNGKLTAEGKDKLERYEALEKNMSALAQENEMLKAKVTEYVEKLASIEENKLDEKIKSLEKQLNEAKCASDEIAKLKKEIKSLRDEADGYLMKISELTFENANLTCQLNEVTSKMKNIDSSTYASNMHTKHNGLAKPRRDAYNPYANNGYGTW